MRLARRLYPEAGSHKLGALVDRLGLVRAGVAHRALADAEMAADLLTRIRHDLRAQHGVADPDHAFLCVLQACSAKALPRFLATRRHTA